MSYDNSAMVFSFFYIYKKKENICCGYSLEVPHMSIIHNICFFLSYGEIRKKKLILVLSTVLLLNQSSEKNYDPVALVTNFIQQECSTLKFKICMLSQKYNETGKINFYS